MRNSNKNRKPMGNKHKNRNLNKNRTPIGTSKSTLTSKIKEKYSNFSSIQRILLDGEFPIDRCYVNLVKEEEVKDKEKKFQEETLKGNNFRDESLWTYETIDNPNSTTIEIENIFSKNNLGKEIIKVLVYGRAGIGKSTLCNYMCHQWRTGKLWSRKFDIVIYLPLRQLLKKQSYELGKIVNSFCINGISNIKDEDIENIIIENKNKILFILDGYDEISPIEDDVGLNVLLTKIMEDKDIFVLLTSRPMNLNFKFDIKLENIGFTNENIEQYVKNFYQEKEEILIQFLKSNERIWGISHIPINLDLICSIWEKLKISEKEGFTMTEIYEYIVQRLFERYCEKQGKLFERETKQIIDNLEKIAFKGIINNEIIIPSQKILVNNNDKLLLLKCGLLKTVGGAEKNIFDQDVYFIHFTFQEYFTARYISNCFENIGTEEFKEMKKLISKHKYDPYFEIIWRFTCGILFRRGRNEEKKNIELVRFLNELERDPRVLVGFSHFELMMKCIDECECDERIPRVKEILTLQIPLFEKYYSGHIMRRKNLMCSFISSNNLVFQSVIIPAIEKKNFSLIDNLKKLGKIREELIDALISFVNDQDSVVRRSAAYSLGKIGHNNEKAIDALISSLHHQDSDVRRNAASSLDLIGQNNEKAIDTLISSLHHQDPAVRQTVASSLSLIGQNNEKLINAVISSLNDQDSDVRRNAADSLGRIGQNNEKAINALISSLNDQDSDVRRKASSSLGRIGQNNEKAIDALISSLNDQDSNVRYCAASSLGLIGQNNVKAIDALISSLNDQERDSNVRRNAASSLGLIGQNNEKAIDTIISSLNDQDSDVRYCAASSLGRIGQNNEKAINALISSLNDQDSDVRRNAASSLGLTGQNNEKAIDALISSLNHQDSNVRKNAAESLGRIGQNNEKAIDALISFLNYQDSDVMYRSFLTDQCFGFRYCAASSLGLIGQNNGKAINALISSLNDQDSNVRYCAASSLGRIGQNNEKAIDTIISSLNDQDHNVRYCAASSLGRIGQNNEKAINALISSLNDQDHNVRYCAASSLGRIGQNNEKAIDALISSLNHQDSNVRRNAASSLGKICHKNEKALMNYIFYDKFISIELFVIQNIELISVKKTRTVFVKCASPKYVLELSLKQDEFNNLINSLKNQALQEKLPVDIYYCYLDLKDANFDEKKFTVLHLASSKGEIENILKILSTEKIIIDNQNNDLKETPLQLSVKNGHWKCVDILIEEGADLSLFNLPQDKVRQNIIDILCNIHNHQRKHYIPIHQEIKKLLQINYKSPESGLLNITVDNIEKLYEIIDKDSLEEFNTIIQKGGKYSIHKNDNSILIFAIQMKISRIVKRLLELGFDPYVENSEGKNAIIVCEKEIEIWSNNLSPENTMKYLEMFIEKLICENYCENRFDRSLETAISSYNLHNFNKIVDDLIGCDNIIDLFTDKNNRELYRLYINNIYRYQSDHGDFIIDGSDVSVLLKMRFYLYFKYLIKLYCYKSEQNNIKDLKSVIYSIKKECQVILQTLIIDRTRSSCDFKDQDNITLRYIISKSIIKKIEKLDFSEEISLNSGYQIISSRKQEGHCLFITFRKIEENIILIRVDNRWLNKGRIDEMIHGQYPWLICIDGKTKIKPFLIGTVELNENGKKNLTKYINNINLAISIQEKSVESSLLKIYNIHGSSEMKFEIPFNRSQSIIDKYCDWPYQDLQNDLNANCILSSHNFGVMIRNGEKIFNMLLNFENSEMWQN